MGRALHARLPSLFALAVVCATPPDAFADDKGCAASAARGDKLRRANKLIDARTTLQECTRSECPQSVQRECAQTMSDVLGALPSVVPGAKDGRGRDLVDVKLFIDGKLATETIDGKPLVVNPGVHTFRFEAANAPPVEERVVVRQGEKDRPVTITFATPEDEPKAAPAAAAAPRPAEGDGAPIAAYVVGGLGLAALGAALVIDLGASADARELRRTCAPDCDEAEVDGIRQRYLAAGVTAAIGGAALIAGIVLFFTHSGASSKAASRTPLSPLGPFIPGARPGRAATLELKF